MLKKSIAVVCLLCCLFTQNIIFARDLGGVSKESYEWDNVTIGAGGVVKSYIFHPKEEGYAIAVGDVGGAWSRAKGDERWKNIANFSYDDYLYYGCDGIAVDPNNTDILYYCGGFYTWTSKPGTVLKSTDRGKTWVNTGFNKRAFSSNGSNRNTGEIIMVDPANSNIIYVGCSNGFGLWRSTNQADTWEKIEGISIDDPVNNDVRCVLYDPTSVSDGMSQRIYISVLNQGVYVTQDGGESWNKVDGSPSFVSRMEIANDGTLFAASKTGLFKYRDGKWTDISDVPGANYRDVAVDVNNSDYIVAFRSGDNIMRLPLMLTEDGGKTWFDTSADPIKIKHTGYLEDDNFCANAMFVQMDPFDPKHIVVGDWFGIYETFDITAKPKVTWEDDNLGIEELCGMDMQSHPDSKYRVLITAMDQDGFPISDLNVLQPRKFTDMHLTYGGKRMMTVSGLDICWSDPEYVVRTGVSHHSYACSSYSDDGGNTWKEFPVEPLEKLTSKQGTQVKFSSNLNEDTGMPAHICIARSEHPLIVSSDMGKSWTEIDSLPVQSYEFQSSVNILEKDYVLENTFYYFNRLNGTFYRSTDGGYNWSQMTKLNEPPHEKAVFKMVSIPGSAGEVWFTTGASAVHGITGELYRTRDGFETLEAVSGFTDVVSCGFGKEAPDRTNVTLYVIGAYNEQFGIYRSVDNGNNWVMISDFTGTGAMANGPGTICGDMHDFGVLYVCSGGSGVFYGRPMGTVVEPLGTSVDTNISEESSVIDISFNVNGGIAVKTKGYRQDGALYFPVRDLFDLLKAEISWNDETNTATVSRDVLETVVYRGGAAGNKVTQKFEFTAQSKVVSANGHTVELGAAVKLIDGKLYIPAEGIMPLWNLTLSASGINQYEVTDNNLLIY